MSLSDLSASPYRILLLQADRFLAELETDTAQAIVGPLREAELDIDGLIVLLREAVRSVGKLRAEQELDAARFGALGKEASSTVDAGAQLVRSLQRRVGVARLSGDAAVEELVRLLDGHGLPAEGASRADVMEELSAAEVWLAQNAQRGLDGLGPKVLAQVRALLTAMRAHNRAEERAETRLEIGTNDTYAGRKRLYDLCVRYLGMLDVVNGERLERGERPLPGGNLEVVRQWAATRPGVVAERAEAVAAATNGVQAE